MKVPSRLRGDPDLDVEYEVGDKVWVIPAYQGAGLIAILCTVLEVDDFFRKKSPTAYLFYVLDEPIGHSIGASEMYPTKEEALWHLRRREASLTPEGRSDSPVRDLYQFRKTKISFIRSTWEAQEQAQGTNYPEKKRGEEWFSLADITQTE